MSSTTKRSAMDVAKGFYDAIERGDVDEIRAAMADEIEWVEAEGGPYGGVFHGPDAVLESVLGPLGTEWDEFVVDPDRFVADGETVVAMGTYRGTYGKTGKAFEAPFAHAIDVEDGRIVRFQQYVDTALHNEPLVE